MDRKQDSIYQFMQVLPFVWSLKLTLQHYSPLVSIARTHLIIHQPHTAVCGLLSNGYGPWKLKDCSVEVLTSTTRQRVTPAENINIPNALVSAVLCKDQISQEGIETNKVTVQDSVNLTNDARQQITKTVNVQKHNAKLYDTFLQQQVESEDEYDGDSSNSELFSFLDDIPTTSKKAKVPKEKKKPNEKAKPKNKDGVTSVKRKAVTAGPSTSKKKKAYNGSQMGHGGEIMFELSMMKYVTVIETKGQLMVGIREYYDDNGKLLPSKEGISLTLDQYKRLKSQIASVDKVLKDITETNLH